MKSLIQAYFAASRRNPITAAIGIALLAISAGKANGSVSATLTPNTTDSLSTTPVVLRITGLSIGQSVTIERYADNNGNGVIDSGDTLAEIFTVTDGQVTTIGGVRNTNVPGDEDLSADGQISVNLTPSLGAEMGRLAGQQIIRVSSPTSDFTSFTRTLTITQASYGQSVSGNVTDGTNPLPYARVFLLSSSSNGNFVMGALADASGQYTLSAPAGSYMIIAAKNGYLTNFGSASAVELTVGSSLTQDISLTPATTSISGKVTDDSSGTGLGGVQLFIANSSGLVGIVTTNADGTYSVPVTASQWGISLSSISVSRLGYVVSGNQSASADTSGGDATGVNISPPKVTSLVYGTVINSSSVPQVGISVGANDGTNTYYSGTTTDSSGNYLLGTTAGQWYVGISNDSPGLAGYIVPNGQSLSLSTGQSLQQNFTLTTVTANLQGVVTNNGSPVSGIQIVASNQIANEWVQTTTAADGSFNLGVFAGTWFIQLNSGGNNPSNLIGPNLGYTVTTGQTISGISYPVLYGTSTINGVVTNSSSDPVSYASVYAFSTIDGVSYNINAQTDGSGNYSLPVLDGTWQIGVNANGYPSTSQVSVTISGSSQTQNFSLTSVTAYLQGTVTNNGSPLSGIPIVANNQTTNQWVQTTTAADGSFNLGVFAGTWSIQLESGSNNPSNLIGPNLGYTVTTGQTISGISYPVFYGTSTISGVVTNSTSDPVGYAFVNAFATIDGASYYLNAQTDGSGNYSLPVIDGTWQVGVNANGYPSMSQLSVTIRGSSQTQNFTLTSVTAYLQGIVTNNGSAVSGIPLVAYNQDANQWVQTTSAADGSFNLGVFAGTWSIQLESGGNNRSSLLGPNLGYTVTIGQTISSISYPVLYGTSTISGVVTNSSSATVSNASVNADAIIDGTSYNVNAQTDGSGNYSLPVIDGTWQVGVYANGYFSPSQVSVTISGSGQTQNFTLYSAPTITTQPADQTVLTGQNINFTVTATGSSLLTYQWQVSADGGSTWSTLGNDSTYDVSTPETLNVNATTELSGCLYQCIVSNIYGQAASNPALLTVYDSYIAPGITGQPSNQTVNAGHSATFSVSVSGFPAPSIQWQVSTDGGSSWSVLSNDTTYGGVTSPVLTVRNTNPGMNGFVYQSVATNSVSSTTSNDVILTVNGGATFSAWQLSKFNSTQLGNSAISGPLATPANDGVSNLFKYAFNLDPFTSITYSQVLAEPTVSGNDLIFTFQAIRTDVNYSFEASNDLSQWTSVTTVSNGTQLTATYSMTGHPSAYFRVRVTMP